MEVASAFPSACAADDEDTQPLTDARIRQLTALQKQLKNAATAEDSRDAFCSAFKQAQRVLELTDQDLAKLFQLSRPTVGRWVRGEAAPHHVGRKPILLELHRQAAARLRQLNG